jgi:NTE family protein
MMRWLGSRSAPPYLNLALQGGGAHGAFTWGVLEGLLEDQRVRFEGLSGSSAGAMNAVAFADGWMKGGREGARHGLADFWTEIGKRLPSAMVSRGAGDDIALSPAGKMLASWAAYFSPLQLNPFDVSPLRGLLERRIDFRNCGRAARSSCSSAPRRPRPASCGCSGRANSRSTYCSRRPVCPR